MAARPGFAGTCWPSPVEEQVLRAAALEPEAASVAWKECRADLDLQEVGSAEVHRLLPAVYANLRATGTDDPDLPLLKGLYRRSFYANRLLMHRSLPPREALAEIGITPVACKGLPIALLHTDDLALRPMGDVDVVVTPAEAPAALARLADAGWRDDGLDPVRERTRLRWRHGANLVGPDGTVFDLHWRLRPTAARPGAPLPDDLAGAEVEPLTLPDEPADAPALRALGPTDLLLHVVEHGLRLGSGAQVRWAWDVATILRSAGDRVDWSRLVARADAHRSTLLLRGALDYVAEVLDAPVPDATRHALHDAPATRRDRRVHAFVAGPRRAAPPRRLWAAASADWPAGRAAVGFPAYLRDSWGLRSVLQVPREAAVRFRRARRAARAPGPTVTTPGTATPAPAHARPATPGDRSDG